MWNQQQMSALIDIFLDFGEAMLSAGGEIGRVEDSLARLGAAYGATKTNVFVITSSIELTLRFADGESITRTCRINRAGGTDFVMLGRLNALSRRCVASRLPIEDVAQEIAQIKQNRVRPIKFYCGSVLAAFAFSLFFGGSFWDALASGAFAVLICFLQDKIAELMPNRVFFLFITSLLTGIGVCLLARVVPSLQIDKIIIGDIMLLVPGIAITNAVRDTLIGDTISGLVKLADSLAWAAALAAGFMLAMFLFAG